MSDSMQSLKNELVEQAGSMGAVDAKVASREMMEGPPSADPDYVLPGFQSVIAFAVPLGTDFIPDYFGKVTRMAFKKIMYEKYLLCMAISNALAARLQQEGFRSESLSPNGSYRPESGGTKPMEFLVPDFSLRYAAVASGLGAFGWSGNVMVEGHWSAVFLGSTITEAELPSDEPLDKKLCDDCRICTKVCPLEFVQRKETQTVTLGGREYTYSARSHHLRCLLGCGGLNGRSRDRKWSSWATVPYEYPETDDQLVEQYLRALNDPKAKYILPQLGLKKKDQRPEWVLAAGRRSRGVVYRSLENTNPTCCNCLLVCSGPKEKRQELMKLLHSSGVVIRLEDGTEKAVPSEKLKEA
ncbi:MAG: epoxyqueuosine reductase [Deltaproteobacteria bacterium]|nr:epoxyqueuosine reductase [Deltaproteobacteria bacterium]